jgi:hypothetical protein
MYIYIYIYTELSAIAHTRGDSFKLGLMSLADQSPCTSWLAQYERTEACRAALALNVSGWPASRSAVAPRLTPSIKQIAQQSRVSLRTRDDMPRPVAFGLARPPRARGGGGLCTVTTHHGEISCAIRACRWTQKATAGGAGKVQAQKKANARPKEKKPPLLFKHNFRKLVLHSRAKEPAIFC